MPVCGLGVPKEHSLPDSDCKFTYSDTVLYCTHFSCHRSKIVVEVRLWSAQHIHGHSSTTWEVNAEPVGGVQLCHMWVNYFDANSRSFDPNIVHVSHDKASIKLSLCGCYNLFQFSF